MGREIIYLLLVARHGWEAFAVVVVVVAFVLVVFVVIVATTTQRDDQTATAKLPDERRVVRCCYLVRMCGA